MSQDQPSLREIIRTTAEFVDGIVDQVDDAERYNALCVSHLLRVADRELTMDEQQERRQLGSLETFMGEKGPIGELYGKLCRGIRAGRYDERWDETLELVMQHVIDRVKVSKPEHLDPSHRD